MALPTGTITMNQVNVELGNPGTSNISLNDADVRTLASIPSGTISMDDLRGKSAGMTFSGGTVFTPGNGYRYHVFTSSGPLTGTGSSSDIDYLAIGGGGGGGAGRGGARPLLSDPNFGVSMDAGGGGAGGFTTGTMTVSGPISTTVTIGGGGAGGRELPQPGQGSDGSNTTIPGFSITAGYGGGGGAGQYNLTPIPLTRGRGVPLGSGGGSGVYLSPTGYDPEPRGGGGPQGDPGENADLPPGPVTSGGGGGIGGGSGNPYNSYGKRGSAAPPIFSPIPTVGPDYSAGGGGTPSRFPFEPPNSTAGGPSAGSGTIAGGSTAESGATNRGGGGGSCSREPSTDPVAPGPALGHTPNIAGNGGSGFFVFRYLIV